MNASQTQFRTLRMSALLCAALAMIPATAMAAVSIPSVSQGGVRWQITVPTEGVSLRVISPDGSAFEQHFPSGVSPWFYSRAGGMLPDGIYRYELVMSPVVQPQVRARALSSRESGEVVSMPRGSVESGVFRVSGGLVALSDPSIDEPLAPATATNAPPVTTSKPISPRDVVNPDDFIVQGSLCVGLDCVINESFGFDTIRLKENNTRIKFEDTSASAGFPSTDWQLTANDSVSGGANKFSIEDITNATVPFTVTGGAPTDSVFVDSTGRVGLRTSTPVLDMHIDTSNTPAIRLEQNSSGGFTSQTWDIAGNEANFFVRDVTGGSRLPLRIRPGAPTSSIDIASTGFVGIGTATPAARLDVNNGRIRLTNNLANPPPPTSGSGLEIFYDGLVQNAARILSYDRVGAAWLPLRIDATNLLLNTVNTGGRVGIGTTSPDQMLSVNGNASKVGGGSWLVFSDERLKNIKGRYSSGLDAIMQLQPVRYEYKPDNVLGVRSQGEHIGFGADALRKVIPEAVTQNAGGYLMVNNDPIIWTMLNAIKEQQAEITQLKAQLKRLQVVVRNRTP